MSLTSLVRFIKHFILFDAIVNAADFYLLILYSAVLLNLFISHNNFFFVYGIFSFSCLVALAKTSSTPLNRSGKSRHSCLLSDHRGKACGLSSLNMMLTGLSYMAFIMLS